MSKGCRELEAILRLMMAIKSLAIAEYHKDEECFFSIKYTIPKLALVLDRDFEHHLKLMD